ncbi:Death on curing protein, Doc toxin [hydrothermal vent metagenome]|uniref:Death on curing protein, Doc toxin n=1 Tax=hydrothermal vent metagenome TaxID=652676 RepID=A0A1W1BZH1_9ZZZZ
MKQGEIWQINLDPTIGSEMKKLRPCIVLNNNMVGKLALKVIAPITDFKEYYRDVPWMVIIEPNSKNGLKKISTIDLFQVRSLSQKRLIKKIGFVEEDVLYDCRESLNIVFE